ncbi:MAG: YncE family protein [Candidatus Kapaibacteriales bacterium]
MNKFLYVFLLLKSSVVFFLFSCSNETTTSIFPIDTTRQNIALVLCEGLWGFDNATLSKVNLNNFTVINDFLGKANPNFKIGDIGNDLVVKGDTFFVVVTTSKAIEYFQLSSGKLLGFITLDGNSAPRKLAFLNDSICVVTDLYQDCVHLVNIRSNKVVSKITVGPAPEAVVIVGSIGYVVNSGYGDYRANEPKAGTISVLDFTKGFEVKNIWVGPNPVEAVLVKDLNWLIVGYYHLPSLFVKDSIGGIVAFNLESMTKVWEIRANPRSLYYDSFSQTLFYLNDGKLCSIDFTTKKEKVLLINPNKSENWYSLAVDSKRKLVMIGNAMNYIIEGSILIYDFSDSLTFLKNISVGVNPNKIIVVDY